MLALSQHPMPWPVRAVLFAAGLAGGAALITPLRAPRPHPIFWFLLWCEIANLVWRYLTQNAFPYFRFEREHFDYLWPNRLWLIAHIVGGTSALLLGPALFWSGLRARYYGIHHRLGYLYLLAVAIAALCSFRLAWHIPAEEGGPAGGIGMGLLGAVWLATIALGLRAIKGGDVPAHTRWMIRSYAVTLAFVNLRWFNEFRWVKDLGPSERVVPVVIWLSWLIPLALVEIGLRWPSRSRAASSAIAAG